VLANLHTIHTFDSLTDTHTKSSINTLIDALHTQNSCAAEMSGHDGSGLYAVSQLQQLTRLPPKVVCAPADNCRSTQQKNSQPASQPARQTEKQTDRQTDRQTEKQTDDRQTDKQRNRQTNRQTVLSSKDSIATTATNYMQYSHHRTARSPAAANVG
jgi:hypothetical protein